MHFQAIFKLEPVGIRDSPTSQILALSKIICKWTFSRSSPCRLRLGSAAVIQREGNVAKSNKVCQRDTAESKARGTVCIKVNLNWLD